MNPGFISELIFKICGFYVTIETVPIEANNGLIYTNLR
jgi:hypothetical protein